MGSIPLINKPWFINPGLTLPKKLLCPKMRDTLRRTVFVWKDDRNHSILGCPTLRMRYSMRNVFWMYIYILCMIMMMMMTTMTMTYDNHWILGYTFKQTADLCCQWQTAVSNSCWPTEPHGAGNTICWGRMNMHTSRLVFGSEQKGTRVFTQIDMVL